VFGCAHAPTKPGERADLVNSAHQTLAQMTANDPGLRTTIDNAAAYIVFPKVGSGGFIVGGGAGSGVLFEHGMQTGFATVEKTVVGAVAGGQSYSQLVIIETPEALAKVKAGEFNFGAQASAIIARDGVATNATFRDGIAVVIKPIKGAMVNASMTGQRLRITM
jgi:lipid-binding SYLF domain-containing protein